MFKRKCRPNSRGLDVPTRVPLNIWQFLDGMAVRRELARLGAASPPRLDECKFDQLSAGRATWRLTYGRGLHAYVSVNRGEYNEERYVVLLDAERFYRAWLSSSLTSPASPRDCFAKIRERMPLDYKFEEAVKGFRHGRENPVPLPTITSWHSSKGPRIGFSDGVTRTYWLLYNRVGVFPAEVRSQEDAHILHGLVGAGLGPMRCSDIFRRRDAL
ncbi:plasmid fertility inhibition factor family protein [Sphingomonas cavernae]|uniref:plasmid fertility inhibition factor family protein n=1 Tax=Sphingomonas cavernae TaxID=2320861 RepID=UPI0026822FE8